MQKALLSPRGACRLPQMVAGSLVCEPLARIAAAEGLQLVVNRDIGSEYAVVPRNYGNFAGRLPDAASYKEHQGFLGSLGRRILTVQGGPLFSATCTTNGAAINRRRTVGPKV